MEKHRFQCILFDLDGTLSESGEGITKSVQYALHRLGIEEPDLKSLESFVGPPLNTEFQRRYHFDEKTTQQAVALYRERYGRTGIFECRLYPGIPEMLSRLRSAGIYLAVSSSKPEPYVIRILEHFGAAKYFAAVCGSAMDEEKRPGGADESKERVAKRALDRLLLAAGPCPGERMALVGDRCFDVEGARKCGIVPVGVTYGYGSREELLAAGAAPEDIADDSASLERILLS